MAMEDELENQNAGGGEGTAAASATPPPPAPVGAGVAAPAGVAANSDPATMAGAQMVGSAIDAATAPGQSVTDAANAAATESELRGVAQAVTAADRYKANQNGMTSPPSAWAQDVNDLYAGLTRAAQRSAERLAQGQQQGSAAAPNEQKTITVRKDGLASTEPPPKGALDEAFTADELMNTSAADTPAGRELDETLAGFGF